MHTKTTIRCLLLNTSYEPLKIVGWQKALILWFQGKVEIIDYHNVFARSARASFQLPSIIRLKTYVRPRITEGVRFCRENVYIRDDFTCQYCGDRLPARHLTLDHVVPASHKGKKVWTNVVSACRECNQRKANRTPKQANMPLHKEPRAPVWLPVVDLEISPGNVPDAWLQYLRYKAG